MDNKPSCCAIILHYDCSRTIDALGNLVISQGSHGRLFSVFKKNAVNSKFESWAAGIKNTFFPSHTRTDHIPLKLNGNVLNDSGISTRALL